MIRVRAGDARCDPLLEGRVGEFLLRCAARPPAELLACLASVNARMARLGLDGLVDVTPALRAR